MTTNFNSNPNSDPSNAPRVAPTVWRVSWEDVEYYTCMMIGRIPHREFDGIVAVTRGGLVPAAICASRMNIKLIDTICISSYRSKTKAKTKSGPKIIKGLPPWKGPLDWLIIDDISDTGETAKAVKREVRQPYHFACVFAKPLAIVQPEVASSTFGYGVPQDLWLKFPWEP